VTTSASGRPIIASASVFRNWPKFRDARATIQSDETTTRKPIGWMAPRRWIGSRSQFVRSTWG